ncbi:unnamed protein product [Cuscuta campestris]|uniref:Cysteine proteinase inhibitor n=2 Tax=Cuscuta sect. Cleistogrammica TaxID=1824901 RepID=A0A484N642_9ASTE|nr:hypothetical protein DM860_006085 [Cuscuta australis]VFQ95454.1 unnamed protein product [Cuscuta campestris]
MATVGGISEANGSQNSLEAEQLARLALSQHNARTNSNLEFGRVVKVRKQVVAGTMHHITLEANDGGHKKVYEAKVWEKPWENFKELQEFKLVTDGAPSSS